MHTIHLDPKQVPSQLRGAYNGRKFTASVCETVTIPSDADLWSGGQRDRYYAVELATGHQSTPAHYMAAPWDNRHDCTVTLRPGVAIVRHSQGFSPSMHYYVHASDAVALLPPPAELSDHEKIVLDATCGLKASYNGMDRYEMKKRECYGQLFPTREGWNQAKESLIARGYLNKAGAVTTAGRNARPSRY